MNQAEPRFTITTLANFAAALLSGPLAEKVNAVAERLLDCRELDGVEFCQCLGKSQDGLAFGSSDAEIDGQHDAGFAFAKHATGFAFAKRDAVVPAPSARATK